MKRIQKPVLEILHWFTALTPQTFFAYMSVFFGLLFVFIIPPFHNPDEPAHFFRVYQLSNLKVYTDIASEGPYISVPSSVIQSVKDNLEVNGTPVYFHPENKYPFSQITKTLQYRLDEKKQENTFFAGAVTYAPTSYLAQVVAVLIGRAFDASPVLMLYMARLAGLALFIIAVYWAIQLMPSKKWIMVLFGLLPMTLVQATAISADSILLASIMLFIATILYLQKDRASLPIAVTLVVTTIVLALSKQIFVLAILPLLAVPQNAFKSRKVHHFFVGGTLLVSGLLAFLWRTTNPVFKNNIASAANGADPVAQLHYVAQAPLSTVTTFLNTFFGLKSDLIYKSFTGVFGWLDTQIPLWLSALILGLIVYVFLVAYEKHKKGNHTLYNSTIFISVFMLTAVTCAIFYLFWTPPGGNYIQGLQGRYFIPIIILLAFYQGRRLLTTDEKTFSTVIKFGSVVILSSSLLFIASRFYG